MTSQAEGKLTYKRPRQMRWEYEKPERQVFIANQELAWLYVPSENQVSLFDAQTFFSSPLARTFFDGVSDLKKHFDVILDFNLSTGASAVLKLVPKQEDPNFRELFLWINMQTYRISQIESHDLLGNTNRIMIEPEKRVSDIDPTIFQMNVPPSTVVTDMQGRQLPPAEVEALRRKLSK
jgi:outer membrane lipoprotein carrier protein